MSIIYYSFDFFVVCLTRLDQKVMGAIAITCQAIKGATGRSTSDL